MFVLRKLLSFFLWFKYLIVFIITVIYKILWLDLSIENLMQSGKYAYKIRTILVIHACKSRYYRRPLNQIDRYSYKIITILFFNQISLWEHWINPRRINLLIKSNLFTNYEETWIDYGKNSVFQKIENGIEFQYRQKCFLLLENLKNSIP